MIGCPSCGSIEGLKESQPFFVEGPASFTHTCVYVQHIVCMHFTQLWQNAGKYTDSTDKHRNGFDANKKIGFQSGQRNEPSTM